MKRLRFRHGLTRMELLVLIAVMVVMVAVLVPMINSNREQARRARCVDNMKQIGLALHGYAHTFGHLPGSAELDRSKGEPIASGPSFLVKILPYIENGNLINAGQDMPIKQYMCPSNPNNRYDDNPGRSVEGYFTNYKGMGATCGRALAAAMHPELKKIESYEPASGLADGVLFPGDGIRFEDINDGTAHTFMLVETIDDSASVWTVGGQASLAGLPNKIIENSTNDNNGFAYFAPEGYNFTGPTYGETSPQTAANLPERPFVAYDFSSAADATKYSSEDTVSTGNGADRTPPRYGPSSAHPGVVNHGFAAGSVMSINKMMDCAAYMFRITRYGSDPGG
jgi:hypothetical protein